MTSTEIIITRPAGNYRAFERPATLSEQRYRLLFEPGGRGVGCWYLTMKDVIGTVLFRSIRFVKTSDLYAPMRARVDLPPGRLRVECSRDPQLEDLTTGDVHLWYDEDD